MNPCDRPQPTLALPEAVEKLREGEWRLFDQERYGDGALAEQEEQQRRTHERLDRLRHESS